VPTPCVITKFQVLILVKGMSIQLSAVVVVVVVVVVEASGIAQSV
jgi:hypothetical protein